MAHIGSGRRPTRADIGAVAPGVFGASPELVLMEVACSSLARWAIDGSFPVSANIFAPMFGHRRPRDAGQLRTISYSAADWAVAVAGGGLQKTPSRVQGRTIGKADIDLNAARPAVDVKPEPMRCGPTASFLPAAGHRTALAQTLFPY